MLLRQLYLSHMEARRFADALSVAEQMVEGAVMADVAHQDAARACLGLTDPARAIVHLRIASRVSPPTRRAFHLWTLGSVLYFAGRHREAIGALGRAARWGTTDKPLYRGQLALARISAGEPSGNLRIVRERLDIRIGPLVTPLSRRRVHKLARETVTLDLLSRGRLTLGVGLGSDHNDELAPFGEVTEPRERARLLDEGLERLAGYWSGEFEPRPVQEPRIPVWVASRWPNRRPLRRAARWDGLFPIELPGPEGLAELAAELAELRAEAGATSQFDLVVDRPPGDEQGPWADAGATWVLADFGRQPRAAEVREVIAAGPG
jgi:hypothetical protein